MMTKPNFRPIAPLEDVDDAALERVNETLRVPTMVRSGSKAPTPSEPSSRPAALPPRQQQKLTVRIPVAIADALKQDALTQRSKVRILVLKSLRDAGYPVLDEDLLPGAGGSD
jgi:hypothetical protein